MRRVFLGLLQTFPFAVGASLALTVAKLWGPVEYHSLSWWAVVSPAAFVYLLVLGFIFTGLGLALVSEWWSERLDRSKENVVD